MKYIVNILLFFIMVYSLTVMPIDMKALQVDVSWEKYKAIEEKKENEQTKEVINETIKEGKYELTHAGETYFFNPTTLSLTLKGDEKVASLKSDVINKLVFKWVNTATGDEIALSVPESAIQSKVSPNETSAVDIEVSLANLTTLPDGQYTLNIHSDSELTKTGLPVSLDVSWFKQATYAPHTKELSLSGTIVDYYYPDVSGKSLIPITQSVSKDKSLRKIANHLYTGVTDNPSVKSGSVAPRIRNIQLKAGKLQLYITTADAETAKALGLTPALMTQSLARTFYSLPYISEIYFYINNVPVDENWNPIAEPLLISKLENDVYSKILIASGKELLYVNGSKQILTPADLIAVFTEKDEQLKGQAVVDPLPKNVKMTAAFDTKNTKRLMVDLAISGTLYNGDPNLTSMLLDTIALNAVHTGLAKDVQVTVNGQITDTLNTISIKDPLKVPSYLNTNETSTR